MSKIAVTLSIACAAVAAAATPAAALDPQMVCPDMFVPALAQIAPPGTDKNANGITCTKAVDGILIWRDDLLKVE